MGSTISKPRSLPKSVPKTPQTINRTHDVDQLFRIKEKLITESPATGPRQGIVSNNHNKNKTVSDFISKRLGNLRVEKEYLQLDPDHSSLRRLTNKKKLEEDYKKIINNLDNERATVLDVNIFKEILMSIGSDPVEILKERHRLSDEIYDKISSLSKLISIPTTKITLPSQRRREQRIKDDDTNIVVEDELSQAFSSILEGSQTGYDLSSGKGDEHLRHKRESRRKLKTEFKRSF